MGKNIFKNWENIAILELILTTLLNTCIILIVILMYIFFFKKLPGEAGNVPLVYIYKTECVCVCVCVCVCLCVPLYRICFLGYFKILNHLNQIEILYLPIYFIFLLFYKWLYKTYLQKMQI